MWRKQPVSIESFQEVEKRETFTLNVSFTAENAPRSFHGEEIRLRSQAMMHVYVNQHKYIIGPDTEAVVNIEGNSLVVVYPSKSLAVPALLIEADFLPKLLSVDPSHRLKKRLEEHMTDPKKLREAQISEGVPLVDPSVSDADLENVAQLTKRVMDDVSGKSSAEAAEGGASAQPAIRSLGGI